MGPRDSMGSRLRVRLLRLAGLVRSRGREDELGEEIQQQLDLLTQEHIAQGMSEQQARDAARRAFGNVDQVKVAYRHQRGLPGFDALLQDVRFAFRVLARDRAFTLTAVLVLGIGVGVNSVLSTVIYAHTLRGLPIDRVDRVLHLSATSPRAADLALSYPDFQDLRSATSFGDRRIPDNARRAGRFRPCSRRVTATHLSADAFAVGGAEPFAALRDQ